MTGTLAAILVVACVMATIIQEAEAACCRKDRGWYCADCTKATPYCGYGSCNIFGCACKDGCRKSCNPTYQYERFLLDPVGCKCSKKRSMSDGSGGVIDLMDAVSDFDTDRGDYMRN
ncbi:protein Diedel [Lingula anatina]|uniref:Protein Diedel n=1 Tax=Lingula anatina TaxID=7574 RepID=A0A1S3K0P7_LINAN|nr:protein Diedel [Lingula anatina]|eukprot:XP_013416208.1 protein Diedel [Lingula anatina]